ncbi:MAG: Lpg1974 family pore-forming outer membrane protein [Parachlamydiales bacterium]|jgi:hypothetical protein
MKKTIVKIGILSLLSMAIQAFAIPDVQPSDQNGYEQGYGIENQLSPAYNASARIATSGSWNANLWGSFIYFSPREEGLTLGGHYTSSNDTVNIIDTHFTFKPGFKVGAGFNLGHDSWVMGLSYLWFHNEHKTSSGALGTVADQMIPFWNAQGTQEYISHLSSTWHLKMDLLDWEFSRPLYSGKYLTCSPVIGLRGGWIGQKLNNYTTHYSAGTSLVSLNHHKQNSYLVGLRGAVDTRWVLGHGLRIFADLSAALFYQHFRNSMVEYNTLHPTTVYVRSPQEKRNCVTPNLDLNGGLGYGCYLGKNNGCHMDLSLGYTFQIFWNQNRMRPLQTDIKSCDTTYFYAFPDSAIGDLFLQGLIANARVDF